MFLKCKKYCEIGGGYVRKKQAICACTANYFTRITEILLTLKLKSFKIIYYKLKVSDDT